MESSKSRAQDSLQILPKVELHRHLEGALRFSTLVELARTARKDSGAEIPKDEASQRRMFLVEEPMTDLVAVLNKFGATQAVLNSEEALSRITYEAIEDAVSEGIKILELRYAPTFILEGHANLNFESIHRGILKGLKEASKLPIAVGLICIFQRTKDLKTQERVFDFFKDTSESWIGADLADDEHNFPAKNFHQLFDKISNTGLPITIHAGEVLHKSAPQNVMDAVTLLHAKRIGHGLQIINDASILRKIVGLKIPLELCPTSNWLTNAIPNLQAHPIRKLMEAGVLCTINSDDPGVFGIDLVNEYRLLDKSYGFTEKEFIECNDIAARASFIPIEKKQKYWPRKI
jgi:adenosine deaminase